MHKANYDCKSAKEIKCYRDLRAWELARRLVKRVYKVTKVFPREEMYCLTQQVRRAVISVPSNIAEGYGRGSLKDYVRFLQTARGSLFEVETQLLLAEDLGYVTSVALEPLMDDVEECSKVLQGLITSLRKKRDGDD